MTMQLDLIRDVYKAIEDEYGKKKTNKEICLVAMHSSEKDSEISAFGTTDNVLKLFAGMIMKLAQDHCEYVRNETKGKENPDPDKMMEFIIQEVSTMCFSCEEIK